MPPANMKASVSIQLTKQYKGSEVQNYEREGK